MPALEAGKGKAASAAYAKLRALACAERVPAKRKRALEGVGLSGTREETELACAAAGDLPEAVAAGSFVQAGAAEALLAVPSGKATAEGSLTLVLMRDGGGGFGYVGHLLRAEKFEAPLKVTRASATDVLLLCRETGNGGSYPGRCGVFEGARLARLLQGKADRGSANDFEVFTSTACGPALSVSVEGGTIVAGRLEVRLRAAEVERTPRGPDETPDGPFCSGIEPRKEAQYPLSYDLGAGGVKRLSPVPRALKALLDRAMP